jgi:hypothetical protein
MTEFRTRPTPSNLAGAMPPDGETIGLYPPTIERSVMLASRPDKLSFITIVSRHR